ncbi:hypothetical protein [Paraclostridium bifermentans]|uniref:hypothetical protein n=1 Tax=Paraclostridium bifermentans TaxID=1490 RepID=UPI001FF2A205|nr:hypothetical protein [Paraclostridium bifermentans]UOW68221.1 hypothetical protein MTR78_01960 [Paraclostridium bifermentans]
MKNNLELSLKDIERLNLLLQYSLDAIEYWFDSCDVDNDNLTENKHFINECNYFLKKLRE